MQRCQNSCPLIQQTTWYLCCACGGPGAYCTLMHCCLRTLPPVQSAQCSTGLKNPHEPWLVFALHHPLCSTVFCTSICCVFGVIQKTRCTSISACSHDACTPSQDPAWFPTLVFHVNVWQCSSGLYADKSALSLVENSLHASTNINDLGSKASPVHARATVSWPLPIHVVLDSQWSQNLSLAIRILLLLCVVTRRCYTDTEACGKIS